MALLLVGGCATGPRTRAPVWHRAEMALCEDYPEETRTIEKAKQDLAAAKTVGATALRIAFGWDAMEPSPGRYDWSFWDEYVRAATDDFGIRLIPYICYTPKWAASDQGEDFWRSPPRDPAMFARFVGALVTRYRDRIHSWELWNEPDNRAYWLGTPEQFAALSLAGSEAVRRADPKATIVLGGIAGELDFLAKALRVPGVSQAVDVVNIHSYFETWHPNSIEQLPNYIESAAGLTRETGGAQPLWMAETGYSSVGTRAEVSSVYRARFEGEHTDRAQAAALMRTTFTCLASGRIELFAWYRINDLVSAQDVIGDDNNRHLGIRRVDGSAKPVANAFQYLASLFAGRYAVIPAQVRIESGTQAEPKVYAFQLEDGRRVVVGWLSMPQAPPTGPPRADDRAATVHVTVTGASTRVELRDETAAAAAPGTSTWRAGFGSGELTLSLRGGEVKVAELK